jgi:cytoskeletal protein CcmA (bactofilin family)
VPIASEDLIPVPDLDVPEGVTSVGRTLVVRGEIRSDEHLIIEGRVEGRILAPDHGVAIGRHGNVSSEIMARTITVLGTVNGKLTATERIELMPSGRVEGRLVTSTLIIDEGAFFKGTVDPTLADTVLAVGRHRLKQNSEDAP